MPLKSMVDAKPIRFVTDKRLDFGHSVPLRKSYFIASSYRSGSQYLCWQLWETGCLGAPCEYLNPEYELRILKKRFNVFSHSDYVASLLACRTSKNGVFGLKAHFPHFEAFLKQHPALMEELAPVTYIYISRSDKIAQAVSMAKALQTGWWTSRMEEGPRPPLRYDREMIANCLAEVQQQDLNWRRWLDSHKISPFQVTYNELTADTAGVVHSIVELLGAQDDEREEVDVPPAKKQGDETNEEWIERFQRETQVGKERDAAEPASADRPLAAEADSHPPTPGENFFERHDRLIKTSLEETNSAAGFVDAIRLRHRHDVIVSRNRELFRDARVLDIMSAHGFWTLAALDAGAAHVVGVEPSGSHVATAEKTFAEYAIKTDTYRFVTSGIIPALRSFAPDEFDVVLCKGFFEQCHFPEFFRQLVRLRPKHVILDTAIANGHGVAAHFTVATGRDDTILATPNHELIAFLCKFGFSWRLIDWQGMGISDWTGVQDYAADRHRTYVLERLP
jgi:LPS sulfotransferase NodH